MAGLTLVDEVCLRLRFAIRRKFFGLVQLPGMVDDSIENSAGVFELFVEKLASSFRASEVPTRIGRYWDCKLGAPCCDGQGWIRVLLKH